MIDSSDLLGVDEPTARRVIAVARSIAPGIDSLSGNAREDAIAILQGVVAELPAAGARRVKSQSRNGTTITFADVSSAFTDDDRSALRALCAASVAQPGLPVGSFPIDRPLGGIWPERYS